MTMFIPTDIPALSTVFPLKTIPDLVWYNQKCLALGKKTSSTSAKVCS